MSKKGKLEWTPEELELKKFWSDEQVELRKIHLAFCDTRPALFSEEALKKMRVASKIITDLFWSYSFCDGCSQTKKECICPNRTTCLSCACKDYPDCSFGDNACDDCIDGATGAHK